MSDNFVNKLQNKLFYEAKNQNKRFLSLSQHIINEETLLKAWNIIKDNSDAAGVDNIKPSDIEVAGVNEFLYGIQSELRDKKYRPEKIKRVFIPKDDGTERPIGILTVKDRVVQCAVKLILEPIFEADFEECSYGYRPGRSTKLTSLEIYKWLESGCDYVFDADISKCFDNIPHQGVIESVSNRILDMYVLSLIKSWLQAGVIEKGKVVYPKKGTIQGGIISPLLANIYLDRFDKKWSELNLKFGGEQHLGHLVRFADDFVILSKKEVPFDLVSGMVKEIGLELNMKKTKLVASRDGFDFVGYHFVKITDNFLKEKIEIYPAEKSVKKVMDRINELTYTKLNNGLIDIDGMKDEVNRIINQWISRYRHTNCLPSLQKIQDYYKTRISDIS